MRGEAILRNTHIKVDLLCAFSNLNSELTIVGALNCKESTSQGLQLPNQRSIRAAYRAGGFS
jgi:hypothetical protein